MIDDWCLLAKCKINSDADPTSELKPTCKRCRLQCRTLWENRNYTNTQMAICKRSYFGRGIASCNATWILFSKFQKRQTRHCVFTLWLCLCYGDVQLRDLSVISSVQMFCFLLFCISTMKVVLSTLQYLEKKKKKGSPKKKKHIEVNTVSTGWKLSSCLSLEQSMKSQSTFNQRLLKSQVLETEFTQWTTSGRQPFVDATWDGVLSICDQCEASVQPAAKHQQCLSQSSANTV